MVCCDAALPVEESALSHCAPPKPLAQAPHWGGGSQAVAASLLQAAASSSARRGPARPVRSELNCPPAAKATHSPTLAFSPPRIPPPHRLSPSPRPNRPPPHPPP